VQRAPIRSGLGKLGSRARRQTPSTHTGTRNGLTSTSWKGRNAYHGSLLPELPPAMAAASVNTGNPFAACQTRFGAQIANATAVPSHGHRPASAARGPTASTPTSTPASSTSGSSLFCRARPATTPVASQIGPPSRSERASSQVRAVQASRSYVVVDSRCPTASSTAETPMLAAASTWAPFEPPSSRAIRPVISTTSAAASTDGRRNPVSEPGSTVSIARASSGVSGGWST